MLTPSQFLYNLKYAFRPGKPLLAARLAKAVFDTNVLGRTRLRYVDFAIDFACNLKCAHCFATALKRDGARKMEIADYARVAEEAMALGAVNFSFQGGEPLLNLSRLAEIVAACKPDRNLISVTTNGTLLSEASISALCAAKVDILTVSLDSPDPEKHDSFRGVQGSFKKTMDGVKLALSKGINVSVGAVATQKSLRDGEIQRLVELARDLGVLLYIILPVPAGNWKGQPGVLLEEEDEKEVYRLERAYPFVRTDFKANFSVYGCGAAKEILYLTPYGDVLACPFMHITPGNIFEESLKAIRERALSEPRLAEYSKKCLVATDKEFIETRLSKTFNAKKLPAPWADVFEEKGR